MATDNPPTIRPQYLHPHTPGSTKVDPRWAYVPPVRPDFILNLDREETTSLPAVSLAEADARRQDDFPIQQSNRYPSKLIESALVHQLASDLGVGDSNILVGNGIMSILTYIYEVYSQPRDSVVVPTPGFWPAYTYALQRARSILMPLYRRDTSDPARPTFAFPIEHTRACLRDRPTICYICNPNNPTGTLIPFEYIESLVRDHPGCMFIVDEAYGSFAAQRLEADLFELPDAVNLVKQGHQNLIVARTFSKVYALANYRVGYVISHPHNIATLKAHMGPYDMSEMSLAMAYYNYQAADHMHSVVKQVNRHMDAYVAVLESHGIQHYGGYRNSLLVEGLALGEHYERHGIAVRSMVYQEGIPNPIASTFRVTIPADLTNFDLFMRVTGDVLAASAAGVALPR